MIKKHYSGSARRARNIIWNAAGRYDFDPPFLSFFPDGTPDHYFNMIVGLAEKWYGLERLYHFFDRYDHARRRDEFDEYLWLGLENALFGKESPDRPVLSELRRERALRFYKQQENLSRQQMEYQSMPVYNQQEARWASVLGRRLPLLSPKEKRIYKALQFSPDWDTDMLLTAMGNFLREFFRYDITEEKAARNRNAGPFSRMLMRHVHRQNDRLIVRAGTGEGDHEKAMQQRHNGIKRVTGPSEGDTDYICAVFGKCVLSEKEMRILENNCCEGTDPYSRLWVSRSASLNTEASSSAPDNASGDNGSGLSVKKDLREAMQQRTDILAQKKRNEDFFNMHASAIRHAIRDLSTQIDTVLTSFLKHLPEQSRRGKIRPEKAYRLPVLQDGNVFLKDGEDFEPEICLDLMLDASMSRMNSQEVIAAEAYIIAESFRKLNIPVRITAFRSLRGYTVTEVLKDWNEKDGRGVFGYFAGGWNRDHLALKTAAGMEDSVTFGRTRIILIMTDASPNDTMPIVRGPLHTVEYEGAAAVKAVEETVRTLRNEGIRVGAVFHGNTSHLDDLHQIYGHSCVRIRKVTQLAQGVSDLLLLLIREIHP